MKIMITGGSGFLGREILNRFRSEHETLGLCHSNTEEGCRSVDIRDKSAFLEVLEDFKPDVVIHGAAYRDPDFCEENIEETNRLNVETVRTICETLPRDKRLIFISTDYVFDGENPPYSEDSERCPINHYGKSKCMAEDIVNTRSGSLVLRIPVLVGENRTFETSGFLSQICTNLKASDKEVIIDNYHMRFPTWIRDVANVLGFIVENGVEGVLHMSGLDGGTQYSLTLDVADALGLSSAHLKPSGESVPKKARRPHNSQLAVNKLQDLGYTGFTPFVEVAKQFAETFKISG